MRANLTAGRRIEYLKRYAIIHFDVTNDMKEADATINMRNRCDIQYNKIDFAIDVKDRCDTWYKRIDVTVGRRESM